MIKKFMAVFIATVIAFGSAGCSGISENSLTEEMKSFFMNSQPSQSGLESSLGDDAAFMRFSSPVTVKIGMSIDPTDTTLTDGDNAQNNIYTRYLEKNFNIKVKAEWIAAAGEDYNQKVQLAIAANTLPDAFVINNRADFMKAARANMLYDITGTYHRYASSQVKSILNAYGNQPLQNAEYQKRLLAIPGVTPDADAVSLMMIRQDWLKQCNLKVPRTIDDIANAAEQFRKAGLATIGIVGPDKNGHAYRDFTNSNAEIYSLEPVFTSLGAYPGYWVPDSLGQIQYGTTLPETKKALAKLAQWYQRGILDPEFGERDNSQEVIADNESGIFFGPWWSLGYGNEKSFEDDPKADWRAYPVYSESGKWNTRGKVPGCRYTVINRKVSKNTAKAVVVMNNVLVRDEGIFDTSKAAISWYPLRNVMAMPDEVKHERENLLKILNGKAKVSSFNNPMSEYKLMYQDAQKVKKILPKYSPKKQLSASMFDRTHVGDFKRMYALFMGARPIAEYQPSSTVGSRVYALPDNLERKWPELKKMENQMVVDIITGKEKISYFDTFVKKWQSAGGAEITREIQRKLSSVYALEEN